MNLLAAWFSCCGSCACCTKPQTSDDLHNQAPGYYQNFHFYAEQMRDDLRRPRRVGSFDTISFDNDEDDTDELSELLDSRRGGRPTQRKNAGWFRSWFVGRPREPSNRRSYDAISSTITKSRTPSLISSDSFAAFLSPSARRNSGSSFYYDDSEGPESHNLATAEQYEDFGLADAQIVPDNFVVSVPLRPTKSIGYSIYNESGANGNTHESTREDSNSVHSGGAE